MNPPDAAGGAGAARNGQPERRLRGMTWVSYGATIITIPLNIIASVTIVLEFFSPGYETTCG
jgi:hypothetical protein